MTPAEAVAPEDALLIRALARGEERALESLFNHNLPRVYGLLRMTLPTENEVEAALCDTFCAAAERSSDPMASANPRRWLAAIALEQVERRARANSPASLEEQRLRARPAVAEDEDQGDESDEEIPAIGPEHIAGINDEALAILIRTLDLKSRQALVLGVIHGLDDSRVAQVIGCGAWEVEELKRDAIAGVAEMIFEHERREEELRQQIAAIPYRLQAIPLAYGKGKPVNRETMVVGTKVQFEPTPPKGIFDIVRKALTAIVELFRRHQSDPDSDDTAGDVDAPKRVDPTPGQQPFEQPSSTPSTRGYRSPKLSPGVAVYAMPRGTPTTRRIDSGRARRATGGFSG